MPDLRDQLISLGHDLGEERNAAFDLWTWLPSYKRAQAGHGDHGSSHFPGVRNVIVEAATFIGDRLHPTPDEVKEAGDLYQCPCGEHHPLPGEGQAEKQPALSLDAFMAESRTALELFAKEYRAKHREDPERYPLTMEPRNEGLWTEFLISYLTGGGV